MTPRPLPLLLGALGMGLGLSFAAFVWPTQYRYEAYYVIERLPPDRKIQHPRLDRINRFTACKETLREGIWIPMMRRWGDTNERFTY